MKRDYLDNRVVTHKVYTQSLGSIQHLTRALKEPCGYFVGEFEFVGGYIPVSKRMIEAKVW